MIPLQTRHRKRDCSISISQPRFSAEQSFGKRLAPYRVGKHSNPPIRAKIHQNYIGNRTFCIFGVFFPYFACGAVFLFSRGPSFSQTKHPLMQLQHQSRLQPFGQACPGGECPFFARASLPPGCTQFCVSHGMRRLCAVVVQSIPPPTSLCELCWGLLEIHVGDDGHTRHGSRADHTLLEFVVWSNTQVESFGTIRRQRGLRLKRKRGQTRL